MALNPLRARRQVAREDGSAAADGAADDQMPTFASLFTDPLIGPAPTQRTTAAEAAQSSAQVTDARMLTRDFIHNSLYHPIYGYFSKNAYIFSPPEPVPFNSLKDSYAFMNYLGQLYKEVEDEYKHDSKIARQTWHTPTELFRPHYGYAVARHIVDQFKTDARGARHLSIYEIGAGNGTLMTNILDYLAQHEPEIYKTTEYNIVEISSKLSSRQSRSKLARQFTARHAGVNIINKSIFDWDQLVKEPCFFIAMEVLDNFAHDMIRYDIESGKPLQSVVLISDNGDFRDAYEPVSDPLIQKYLDLRSQTGYVSPLQRPSLLGAVKRLMPFSANLSEPEFIPTHALVLMDRLAQFFPNHRLIISDFDWLSHTVPGVNAPVVQTRYQGEMVPCTTFLVYPGWFDIFFPTNFELLRDIYKLAVGRDSTVLTQREFLEKHANLAATRTTSGENPMLTFYENFKFIIS
nr:hypothetical protein HK105_001528 [Polyrhizophydium stewartii]